MNEYRCEVTTWWEYIVCGGGSKASYSSTEVSNTKISPYRSDNTNASPRQHDILGTKTTLSIRREIKSDQYCRYYNNEIVESNNEIVESILFQEVEETPKEMQKKSIDKAIPVVDTAGNMIGDQPKTKQKDLDSAKVHAVIIQQPGNVKKKKHAFDARAGSSTMKIASPNERKDGIICWMEILPSDIMVRSIGYITRKKKIPSPGSLYECIAVDVLRCERRIPKIGLKVKLDKVLSSRKELLGVNKTWFSPELFVVSVTLPTEAPTLGWSTNDGAGLTLVAYMKMRDDTREILRCITGSENSGKISKDVNIEKINGVRLFEEWCKKSPSDPAFQGRFKFIPSAVNTDEFGIPSYIAAYNGKPVLIKRVGVTGTLYSHADYLKGGFMEFDINLHGK
jgi:hypothetical protein